MKLQAVTICINYADYLECIVENRRHFDRWIVVTVSEDAATQELCARHGIEVLLSRTLRADGKDFNAAHNKSRALNEGLDALDAEGWAVILDSDVLLPRHFRARVEALPLERGCLYAVAGRKICEDREMFEMLRPCEPWDRLVGRNTQALGYFNLFHLGWSPNRYPASSAEKGGEHDDFRFTTSFPPECRRQIPMTVIHTGAPATNWAGRVAASYQANGAVVADTELPEEIAGTGSVAVIGYFPGSRWRAMAGRFGKVLLVDHCQVHHPSGSAMVEADRAVLRGLWAQEAEGCGNVELLGTHSAGTLAKIKDGSLDALYLPGEVTPDWLTVALRHWGPKLRDGALVCGDLYGLPHWREATFTLALLLGVPDGVKESGFWWKRMRAADWRFAPLAEDGDFSTQDGVVLVNRAKETLEKLLLTLHTVRAQWAGPVAVYHWGEEDPSLTIACGRMGVRLWNVGEVPEGEAADDWLTDVAAIQPFRRALILQPGMLAVGPLERAFAAIRATTEDDDVTPLLAVRGEGQAQAVASVKAETFQGDANEPAVLTCDGDPAMWTEAAWEVWSLAEAELAQAMASGVRVAEDATVVTFVDQAGVGDFQRSSLTWKFLPGTPVLVLLMGLRAEELWLPGATPETRVVPLSRKQVDDVPWLLRWLAAECQTARVIFLPCEAAALPGAELWAGEAWATTVNALDGTPAAREGEAVTGNRFIPRPFCGMLARARLPEIAATCAARGATWRELPLVMEDVRRMDVAAFPWVDLSAKGWRRPAKGGWIIPDEVPGQDDFAGRKLFQHRTGEMLADVPIRGFYHVLLINHWREIVAEQVGEIVASGLYDAATEFEVGALGPAVEVEALREVLAATPKFRVVFHGENPNLYEHPTLGRLIAAAQQTEFYAVYAHAKGVTYPGDTNASWRRDLNRHIFANWRANVAQLAAGCDTSGGRLYRAGGCWPRHYSGNFWWARAAYIRTLRALAPGHRHDAEMWLLSGRARIHDLG